MWNDLLCLFIHGGVMSILWDGMDTAPLSEDRPAMAFCDVSDEDFLQFARGAVSGFLELNPGTQANSIILTNLNVSVAVLKIREIELKNTNNIYISDNFKSECDHEGMKVNATFGIKDTEIIVKDKPGTPGILVIYLDQFEAFTVVRLPRRDTRIIVDTITVTRIDGLRIEVKPGASFNPAMVNSFLKKMPKNVLMSMVGRYMTKATQEYLDKNPIDI